MHSAVIAVVFALVGRGTAGRVPIPAVRVTLVAGEISRASVSPTPQRAPESSVRPAMPAVTARSESPPIRAKTQISIPARDETAPFAEKDRHQEGGSGSAETGKPEGFSLIPGGLRGGGAPSTTGDRGSGPQMAARTSGGGPDGGGGHPDAVGIIRAAIERAKSYPYLARKRGIEGTATAAFTINKTGRPENIRIIRSSGSDILDTAAMETIRRAAPFPAVNGVIEAPIVFRLEK